MKQVIAAWSGGKDSTLAAYKALQQGYQITHLANTISHEYRRVRFHGVTAELMRAQADAVGIQILQKETTGENYYQEFLELLKVGQTQETYGVVFGDIHLEDCFAWAGEVCQGLGLKALEPLWHMNQVDILSEFLSVGFRAVIVSTQNNILGSEWIGREIDEEFVRDISLISSVDACGENGEYHTFVYDGPMFKKRIEIQKSGVIHRSGYNFLDIQKYDVIEK